MRSACTPSTYPSSLRCDLYGLSTLFYCQIDLIVVLRFFSYSKRNRPFFSMDGYVFFFCVFGVFFFVFFVFLVVFCFGVFVSFFFWCVFFFFFFRSEPSRLCAHFAANFAGPCFFLLRPRMVTVALSFYRLSHLFIFIFHRATFSFKPCSTVLMPYFFSLSGPTSFLNHVSCATPLLLLDAPSVPRCERDLLPLSRLVWRIFLEPRVFLVPSMTSFLPLSHRMAYLCRMAYRSIKR